MKRKLALFLAVVLVGSLVLAGCDNSGSGSGGSTQDTLTVAVGSEPRSLEPHNGSNDSSSSLIQNQVYETLITLSRDNKLVGALAESWEYTDDTTLVIKIREGVKFHNGQDFDANDAFFTLKHAIGATYTGQYVEDIDFDNSSVVDNHTLSIKTFQPSGILLTQLSLVHMFDEQTFNEVGEEGLAENPVGTGPFILTEWNRGDRLEFEAFDKYWGNKPVYKKLIIRAISEPSSRAIEVESGGVDISIDISNSDVANLESTEGVSVHRTNAYGCTYLAFNCKDGVFSDVKLRQAVSYAVDKAAIVKTMFGDNAVVAKGPLTPSYMGYTENVTMFNQDLDKAKALLEEAGVGGGFEFTLTTSNNPDRVDIAEMVQNQLKQVGITVNVETLENATFLDRVVDGTVEMFVLGVAPSNGDPHFGLEAYVTGQPTWSNVSQYSNTEVDDLVEQGRYSVDDAFRSGVYEQAQKIIVDECARVFLNVSEYVSASSSSVKNFYRLPTAVIKFNEVTFE